LEKEKEKLLLDLDQFSRENQKVFSLTFNFFPQSISISIY